MKYKFAKKIDLAQILIILSKYNLPVEDIHESSSIQFIIAKADDQIVGVVGLEKFANSGLLRSLCVEEKFRKEKVGTSLVNKIHEYAVSEKILNVYLLTTTANQFFLKFGFVEIQRKDAPLQIQKSSQFTSLCPSSAILMRKTFT